MTEDKAKTESEDRDGCVSDRASAEVDGEDTKITTKDNDGQATIAGGVGANTDAQVGGKVAPHEKVDGTDVGDSVGAHLDATAHADVKGSASAGKEGVDATANVGAGYGVGGGVSSSAHVGKTKVVVSSDLTIGPQIGVGGTAECKVDKAGILHIKLGGDVAAGVGLKGDVNLDIDTKPLVKAANDTWHTLKHIL
jgi:hypothetical protein